MCAHVIIIYIIGHVKRCVAEEYLNWKVFSDFNANFSAAFLSSILKCDISWIAIDYYNLVYDQITIWNKIKHLFETTKGRWNLMLFYEYRTMLLSIEMPSNLYIWIYIN